MIKRLSKKFSIIFVLLFVTSLLFSQNDTILAKDSTTNMNKDTSQLQRALRAIKLAKEEQRKQEEAEIQDAIYLIEIAKAEGRKYRLEPAFINSGEGIYIYFLWIDKIPNEVNPKTYDLSKKIYDTLRKKGYGSISIAP